MKQWVQMYWNNLGKPTGCFVQTGWLRQFADTGRCFYRERKEQNRSSAVRLRTDVQGALFQRYYGLGDHQIHIRLSTAPVFVTSFASVMCEMFPTRNHLELQRCWHGKVYDKLFNDPSPTKWGSNSTKVRLLMRVSLWFLVSATIAQENKAIKGRSRERVGRMTSPHKKEPQGRWCPLDGETRQKFYGYKMHAKADQRHKMVLKYDTTSANVHDSKAAEPPLDESDEGKKNCIWMPATNHRAHCGEAQDEACHLWEGLAEIIHLRMSRKRRIVKSLRHAALLNTFSALWNSLCADWSFAELEYSGQGQMSQWPALVYNICRYTQIMRLTPVPIA